MFKSFDSRTSLNWLTIINGFYPLQFSLLFIKDLFSEFSLNEFLMNSYEPLVRFSNRIFRVALLFICQCSVFIAISHLIYDMIPTEKMGFEPMRRC